MFLFFVVSISKADREENPLNCFIVITLSLEAKLAEDRNKTRSTTKNLMNNAFIKNRNKLLQKKARVYNYTLASNVY
jgi:hypothetical protein